jgi:hypothetical protein
LPLLLALQALALALLVVSLARPARSAAPGPAVRVYVLDDSIWMQAADGAGTRLDAARAQLSSQLAALPDDAAVRIVAAGARPSLRFAGKAADAAPALAAIAPSDSAADINAAVRLAAGLRVRPSDPIELLHAPENGVPTVVGVRAGAAGGGAAGGGAAGGAGAGGAASGPAVFTATAIGRAFEDRSIDGVSTRCGLPDGGCELLARVSSTGRGAVAATVEAVDDGRVASSTRVTVPPGGSAPVAFRAPAGARLTLRLTGARDPLPADDQAYAVVPSVGGASGATVHVTVVGSGDGIVPLVGALAAQPGVEVRLRTPTTFTPADAAASDLVVVDGELPRRAAVTSAADAGAGAGATTGGSGTTTSAGGATTGAGGSTTGASGATSGAGARGAAPVGSIARAAALLLVNPSRLPGGSIRGHLADARLAGTSPASPLLSGVDLTSLAIAPSSVAHATLPRWMSPDAWARGGPLLASGVDGGQRVALLTFDPAESTLPQLAGFPQLIANVVAWSQAWLPSQASAGEPVSVEQPPGTTATTIVQGGAGEASGGAGGAANGVNGVGGAVSGVNGAGGAASGANSARGAAGSGNGAAAGGSPSTRTLPRSSRVVALAPSAGIVEATQRRAGASERTRALAVEPDPTPAAGGGAPIDLASSASAAAAPAPHRSLAPWFLGAAFAVILAEGAYALVRRRARVLEGVG